MALCQHNLVCITLAGRDVGYAGGTDVVFPDRGVYHPRGAFSAQRAGGNASSGDEQFCQPVSGHHDAGGDWICPVVSPRLAGVIRDRRGDSTRLFRLAKRRAVARETP
ncbi:hypothetical protein D3C80_1230110 [compost metagenome]